MTDGFATPLWIEQLTVALEAALPPPFSLIDDVGERHGSWEWTAAAYSQGNARWLVVSVSPLVEPPPRLSGESRACGICLAAYV